jgi:hypothetical protein
MFNKLKLMKDVSIFLLLIYSGILAQDQEIDASKPTNFYSFIDNTLEYQTSDNQNIYGYRGNLTLAPAEEHLVLAEIPLLYNDRTSKFGLGDIRVRYFWLPYKNYDEFVGAFGPSIDIFAPTGSYEDGLGTSSWVISPGVTVGLMAADWIQFFPVLSYQYVSKQTSDLIPDDQKKTRYGLTFQVLTSVVFGPNFFMQFTPIISMNDFDEEKQDRFVQEIFASYSIQPTIQLTGFFRGNFEDQVYTYRLGLVLYL